MESSRLSDFAGLTGTRFSAGSGETPGEGGEDPVTPPAGGETVAKLTMSSLGYANAASFKGLIHVDLWQKLPQYCKVVASN